MKRTDQENKDKSLSAPLLITFIIIFLAAPALHPNVIIGAYVILCLWTLFGYRQAIQALSLSYVIILYNPAMYTFPREIGVFRWLILLMAGLRILPVGLVRSLRYLIPLAGFFLMVVVLALATSPQFLISFLKIAIFTFCVGTVLTAYDSLDEANLKKLRKWFFCLTTAVILISLPTLFIPRIGYALNGKGFQGIFNHPQAFAVFLAPVAAYLAASLLYNKDPNKVWLWVLGATVTVLIFLSRARTGIVALLLSVGATFAVGFVRSLQGMLDLPLARSLLKISAIMVALVLLISVSPVLSESLEKFLFKGDKGTVGKEFYASRGAGVDFYWNRFLQHPVTGNGFGIDVGHGNEKKPEMFMGIPISAATEKGFLPVAFLEEVGIIGLIVFIPFLLTLFKSAFATGDVGLMSMFFACLFVNIAEAVFFSPGQTGGYLWLLIGLSTAIGWKTKQEGIEGTVTG